MVSYTYTYTYTPATTTTRTTTSYSAPPTYSNTHNTQNSPHHHHHYNNTSHASYVEQTRPYTTLIGYNDFTHTTSPHTPHNTRASYTSSGGGLTPPSSSSGSDARGGYAYPHAQRGLVSRDEKVREGVRQGVVGVGAQFEGYGRR